MIAEMSHSCAFHWTKNVHVLFRDSAPSANYLTSNWHFQIQSIHVDRSAIIIVITTKAKSCCDANSMSTSYHNVQLTVSDVTVTPEHTAPKRRPAMCAPLLAGRLQHLLLRNSLLQSVLAIFADSNCLTALSEASSS